MTKIKVLLIEDNRLLRDGTTAMLNEQKDILVVPTTGNKSALEKAKKLMPDVVLLDLGLKSPRSLKVLDAIKKQCPRAVVVVMDLIPAHVEMIEYVKVGVSGFIPRDASIDDFLNTIRSVAKGEKILPTTMAESLLSQIVETAVQEGTLNRVIAAVKFTKREQEVIALLGEGKSIAGASSKLKVAVFTVNSHIRNILDKLALHSRLELANVNSKKSPFKGAAVRRRKNRD